MQAGDDLDAFVKWMAKNEPKLTSKLDKPGSIVEACQWLSSAKALKDDFQIKTKILATAMELCSESPEIQAIDKRSQNLGKSINVHIAKVRDFLLNENKSIFTVWLLFEKGLNFKETKATFDEFSHFVKQCTSKTFCTIFVCFNCFKHYD